MKREKDYTDINKLIGFNLVKLAESKNQEPVTIDEALLTVWDALTYLDVKSINDKIRKLKHVVSFRAVFKSSRILDRYRNYTQEALREALEKELLVDLEEEGDRKMLYLSDLKLIAGVNDDGTISFSQTHFDSYKKISQPQAIEYGMMPYEGDAPRTYTKKQKVILTSYSMTEDIEKGLQPFIDDYIEHWDYAVSQEDYKWKATKTFQEKFNIGAENLSENIKDATSDTLNLLAGPYYFARTMICKMADYAPDEIRMAFRDLYEESQPLASRVSAFIEKTDAILKRGREEGVFKQNEKSMQSERAVSVYLALRYPASHYLYMYSLYNSFRNITGVELPSLSSFESSLVGYEMVCNSIRDILVKNERLVALHNQSYPDDLSNYHLLTQDFLYYVVNYYNHE